MPEENLNHKIEELKQSINSPKSEAQIFEEEINTAIKEHKRPSVELFVSAITGGLEIGFSVFLMGLVYTMFVEEISKSLMHILISFSYSIGFIFVILGKSVLFTEQTTLAVIPVLNKNATFKNLLKIWAIIYFGNLTGGYIFGVFLAFLPTSMGTISEKAIEEIALTALKYNWYITTGSAILAGWLMGLLSWLVASSQETISRIFIIILVTTIIGLGYLHHSIVSSIEIFTGFLIIKDISFEKYLSNQLFTTIGNIIGGVVFVAFLKYSVVNPKKNINTYTTSQYKRDFTIQKHNKTLPEYFHILLQA